MLCILTFKLALHIYGRRTYSVFCFFFFYLSASQIMFTCVCVMWYFITIIIHYGQKRFLISITVRREIALFHLHRPPYVCVCVCDCNKEILLQFLLWKLNSPYMWPAFFHVNDCDLHTLRVCIQYATSI